MGLLAANRHSGGKDQQDITLTMLPRLPGVREGPMPETKLRQRRFKCVSVESGAELTLPDDEGSQVLVQLWKADGNGWCIGVTFDDATQLLLFETMPGTTRQEALQLALEMRVWLRSVRLIHR
jgi:hypothetical protein